MPETKCVKLIPPCYLMGDKWLNLETGEYFYPRKERKLVYVRINGRRRQAQRWLWLWRIVAEVQGWLS